FMATTQWILDPADLANMAWRLVHPVITPGGTTSSNPNRKAFIQFIEDDETVPNTSSLALVAAASRPSGPPAGAGAMPPQYGCSPPLYCYEFIEAGDPT